MSGPPALPANHYDCKRSALESLTQKEESIRELYNNGVQATQLLPDLLRSVRAMLEICARQQTSCLNPCIMPPLPQQPHLVNYTDVIDQFVNSNPTIGACSVFRLSDHETIIRKGFFFNLTNAEKSELESYFGPKRNAKNKRITLATRHFDSALTR